MSYIYWDSCQPFRKKPRNILRVFVVVERCLLLYDHFLITAYIHILVLILLDIDFCASHATISRMRIQIRFAISYASCWFPFLYYSLLLLFLFQVHGKSNREQLCDWVRQKKRNGLFSVNKYKAYSEITKRALGKNINRLLQVSKWNFLYLVMDHKVPYLKTSKRQK